MRHETFTGQASASAAPRVIDLCDSGRPSDGTFARARIAARLAMLAPLPRSLGVASDGTLDVQGSIIGFRQVADESAAGILATLFEMREGDERWPVRNWMSSAVSRKDGILLAAFQEDGIPAGFIGYRRVVEIEITGEDDLALCYSVRPDYVYAAPDSRAKGIGSAIRMAVMKGVRNDLEAVGSLWEAGSPLWKFGIQPYLEVMGQAESDEGARFMEMLRQDMADHMEEAFGPEVMAAAGPDPVRPAF